MWKKKKPSYMTLAFSDAISTYEKTTFSLFKYYRWKISEVFLYPLLLLYQS